jgi:hypothetical protein
VPEYVVHLANGKSLVLEGDQPPTDTDIEEAAQSAGVRSLLMSEAGASPAKETSMSPTTAAAPLAVGAGAAGRKMVERLALQVATSPRTAKVPGMIGTMATGAVVANDLRKGEYGRAASDAVIGGGSTMLAKAASESALRNGSGAVAKAAGSNIARAITGPGALLATMPFTEAGDRPTGETPQRTADRQADFARRFKEQVNRQAGREVIKGSTTEEIIASIAKYRSQR